MTAKVAKSSSRGSKPGERRGGRQKGTQNKASAEVKDLAKEYGPAAVEKLAQLAGLIAGKAGASSEPAQVAANKEILDRAYGKASQPIEHGGSALEDLLGRLAGRKPADGS